VRKVEGRGRRAGRQPWRGGRQARATGHTRAIISPFLCVEGEEMFVPLELRPAGPACESPIPRGSQVEQPAPPQHEEGQEDVLQVGPGTAEPPVGAKGQGAREGRRVRRERVDVGKVVCALLSVSFVCKTLHDFCVWLCRCHTCRCPRQASGPHPHGTPHPTSNTPTTLTQDAKGRKGELGRQLAVVGGSRERGRGVGADRTLDMTKGVVSPGLSGHFCPSHDVLLSRTTSPDIELYLSKIESKRRSSCGT
jgi:hypothetical protein